MTGFEPGVQLTADTIAAMERLSTSPSKPAMTKQHKATPEQWDDAGAFASDTRACLLELRARVELLEATQHAHLDTSRLSDEERDQIRQDLARPARVFTTAVPRWPRPPHQDKLDRLIALDAADDGEPIVLPSSPAGSLVERVGAVAWPAEPISIEDGARAAILQVADAALQMHPDKNLTWERVALWLEQEANR